ncbi:MAG: hypothetical protein H0X28_10585 [Solirubrobacterales bacterium]|nr:hypothetical protein [Solirubrobacterales bacterium]
MEIRSYRRVFDLERRIYRIDSLRLNPGGIPVRGVVYMLAIVAGALVAAQLPLLGALVRTLPWYLRDLALPVALASVLCLLRLDGRTFHHTGRALLLHWVAPRRLSQLRRAASVEAQWRPGPIVFLPDGSEARLRRLRYSGPGAALVTCEHELLSARSVGVRRFRRDDLVLRGSGASRSLTEGKVIVLARAGRLLIEPARAGEPTL